MTSFFATGDYEMEMFFSDNYGCGKIVMERFSGAECLFRSPLDGYLYSAAECSKQADGTFACRRKADHPGPTPKLYDHHVFCNGDRRFPQGTKGKCCSCKIIVEE